MPHELLWVVSYLQLQSMRPAVAASCPLPDGAHQSVSGPARPRGLGSCWPRICQRSTRSRRSWSFDEHMQPRHLTVPKDGRATNPRREHSTSTAHTNILICD